MLETFLDGKVIVKTGDLTLEAVDAIVNAANHTLLGGGGVDGKIHAKGGSSIVEECRKFRESSHPKGLPTGESVITTGGRLPAKFVIHTVGPIYGQNAGRDADLLANCYLSAIRIAETHTLESIAFPSISTGAFGYPKNEAAEIVGRTLKSPTVRKTSVAQVILVFFTAADAKMFVRYAAL